MQYASSKVPNLLFQVATAVFLVWGFSWLLHNASGKMGEKYKFEIKNAKDISQRLDDVKGIDEIKEEILNLIKMVKDPFKY